jgi:ankyrin repeat domain-containing protein 50
MAETLEGFPSNLETIYKQTWDRILSQGARHANLAKLIFLWIIYAKRDLTIDELRHAVATSPTTHAFEAKRMVTEASLIAACCGLVVVEEESRLARLVRE